MPEQPMPHVEGVTHREVDAGGVRIHIAEAGAGEPLVLVHGWPQHWFMWRGLIPLLAPHYRLICPDLPGFGWSEAPDRSYAKEEFATDLLALLDALELDRVRLAGHDWGGYSGFLACLRAPERFHSFLALGISPPARPGRARSLLGAWRLAYQPVLGAPLLGPALMHRTPGAIAAVLRATSPGGGPWTDEELDAFTAQWRDPRRAEAQSRVYRTMVASEIPAIIRGRYRDARLQVPTLLMCGSRDPVVRGALLEGAGTFAESLEVDVIEGAGHFFIEEQPELVAERALAFLRSGRPAAALASQR